MEKTIETEVNTVAEGRALLDKDRTKMREEAKAFAGRVKMRTGHHALHGAQPKQK